MWPEDGFAPVAAAGLGGEERERLEELLDWAESLGDCLMQGFVGEE